MQKIEKYDDAANFLMMVSDEVKDLVETCHLKPIEALNLMQPLHALIDDELSKKGLVVSAERESKCIQTCHCGIYSDIENEKNKKERLFNKAVSMPKKAFVACAKATAKWFCASQLLETLKSEIASESSSGL